MSQPNTNKLILKEINMMALSIGKIDGLVLQQQELKDDFKGVKNDVAMIQQSQAVLCNDIKHIREDNVEFKESMNKNLTTLKSDYYLTKSVVQKHGIWFTVIHFITVSVIGWLGFKN